jgi:DNA invertase Pin-like site-specific DNA recombinase
MDKCTTPLGHTENPDLPSRKFACDFKSDFVSEAVLCFRFKEAVMRKRAAIYVRVSTDKQTVENQLRELRQIAVRRGWEVVEEYHDAGISGAKGREQRPGLDRMLKDASRRRFDVVMAWAIDRLGRSLIDLLGTIQGLETAGVDLFLEQQAIDTTTPAGKLMFQVTGAFAEFERSMIRQRVNAGLRRAVEQGKQLGRPRVSPAVEKRILSHLRKGIGILKTAKTLGVGTGTVQRIKEEMSGPFDARAGVEMFSTI